ncbi:alpha/beta hydrolase [Shinella zoogloeoides]|uniref:alpha/beta fold hydrolase n=1 Tax=Shinella zoogloeoides TaxID=352475 RepID=UPI0028A67110|nr:alpha/beta hydrolase [Shinella zoogloeoides]
MTDHTSRFLSAPDGLQLHARDYPPAPGGETRLPVICLPGLSRNARDFHQFALLVSKDSSLPRRVIALDYRGRGFSAWDENTANYNVATECQDVIAACTALGISRALFIGTSRGGLILHIMAAVQLDLIAAAVLNDIGPEIEAGGLKDIRDYLSNRDSPATFEAAGDALARIHGPTFPALTRADWLEMAEAIYREKDGRIVTDHDPRLADQLQAIDFSKPLPTLWPQFDLLAQRPLLVVRGEHSRLFSEKTLERMKAHGPHAEALTAEGQGHAPLLHHDGLFARIKDFLDRHL